MRDIDVPDIDLEYLISRKLLNLFGKYSKTFAPKDIEETSVEAAKEIIKLIVRKIEGTL